MSWSDRITGASYTSPSGVTVGFDFETLIVDVENRGSVFSFVDAPGSYVQSTGRSSRRFPMLCYLWGENYDLVANVFIEALGEAGDGTLNHPQQGPVRAVPLGRIRRRDDLVNAANQAVVEVEFFETTGLIYPSEQASPRQALADAVAAANDAGADLLNDSRAFDTVTTKTDFITRYNAALTAISESLAPIYEAQEEAQRQFKRIEDSIDRTIQVLVNDPITLAYQTQQLIKAPSRVATSVSARLDGYSNLVGAMLGTDQGVSTNAGALAANDLTANGALLSGGESAVDAIEQGLFMSRTQAVLAASDLIEQMEAYGEWRDVNQLALETNDTGASWQTLQIAVSTAAGALVEESFLLQQERRYVLDRARTVVDLCAQLYKSVDNAVFDTFITTNNLSGDEIREVPTGKEVVYYA